MTTAGITSAAQGAEHGAATALSHAFHALKVFAGTAVSVVLLGRFEGEEALVKR
ncbi:hypothetical protein ACH4PU_15610 [Streptomyces sp. NPDC021100]|uniref:hypothetical protein n=1 Tax=Streptomyces sp. NPDC021100 TaxID=3365114 RepID=UPI0037A99220